MSLVVVRALGLVTVQDAGRAGHMHEGLAPGGALVRDALVAANRAAGNADFAPAIEVLGRLTLRAEAPIEIATDRTPRRVLDRDAELLVESEPRRATYLAIRGGVAAPVLLGSASTHVAAQLGRPLATGQLVSSAGAPERVAVASPAAKRGGAIRILPGPDTYAFAPDALAAFLSLAYRISPHSDRVGTRLVGPVIERSSASDRSRPTVRGAIEVPRDGQPIVLGPEHPTTGGYPILGVICAEDLDRFFAIRIGGDVSFEVGHVATSRARS